MATSSVVVVNGTILPAPLVLTLTPPTPAPIAANAAVGTVIQTSSVSGGDGSPVTFSVTGTVWVAIDPVSGIITIGSPIPSNAANRAFSYTVSAVQN